MSVDRDTVRRIARLARLAVDDARAETMVGELSGILAWVEQLKDVDVEGVEPLTSVVAQTLKMREDKVTEGANEDALIQNAPSAEDRYFLVPKVVE